MSSQSSVKLSYLLGSLACLSLSVAASSAAASECDSGAAVRWVPERSWPSACEPAALTDGFVLLEGDKLPEATPGGEGSLRIVVERIVQGAVAETFEGGVTRPDATSALFKSDRPLPANADFQISATQVGPDGAALGPKFTSAFTTGSATLPPLAFAEKPTLKLEEAEQERFNCSKDACGVESCTSTDKLELVKSLRIAVPEISGGIDIRSYAVSAELTASFKNGQAPVVATSDTADTQAGKRSFIVLEVPALGAAAEGCVTITATDAGGHTIESEPVCTEIPAEPEPAFGGGVLLLNGSDEDSAQGDSPAQDKSDGEEYGESTDALTANEVSEANAGGCSVGAGSAGGAGALGWLTVALAAVRFRKRATRTA
jgi:hypothetical protein